MEKGVLFPFTVKCYLYDGLYDPIFKYNML